jgi:hypothetical protein
MQGGPNPAETDAKLGVHAAAKKKTNLDLSI